MILVVALVVLGPEQMPVVARGLIKIIRELRAAANDTITEIRQSLEEPPSREYTQWKPPGHQEDEGEKQANGAEASHPADHQPPQEAATSRADDRAASLEASASNAAANTEQLQDRGGPAPQARTSEADQIWESTDAPESVGVAGIRPTSEPPEQAKPDASGEAPSFSERTQASENRPPAQDTPGTTSGAAPASAPDAPSEAAPAKLNAARTDALSAGSESSEPLSNKPQPPHTPT